MSTTIYKCTRKVKFIAPDNPNVIWKMEPGFIGNIPEWVEKDWYFKTCCSDGSITAIKSGSDCDIQSALDKEAAEERQRLEEQQKAAEPTGEQIATEGETTDGNDTAKTDGKKGNGGKK